MSAAMLSLGERIASELGRGSLEQVYIKGEKGYVVLMSVGEEAVLTALAREQAKLGCRWQPAAVTRIARGPDGTAVRDETGGVVRLHCCPSCFAPVVDDEEVPLEWADLARKKRRCDGCGGALWQADRTGPRRVALADYVLLRDR